MANHNSYYGSSNSNWKGSDKISERAKHYRIEAKRGKASAHKCAFCGKRADEWAEMHDGSYKPLCKAHHSAYDKKEKNFQA